MNQFPPPPSSHPTTGTTPLPPNGTTTTHHPPPLLLQKRPSETLGPPHFHGNKAPYKARKPTERTFSEKLTSWVPESKWYNELLLREKRLDELMLRKRMEYQEGRGKTCRLPAMHSKHKHSIRKFSSLVKSLVVELDPELYPKDNVIEWVPSSQVQEVDGFEIKRHGSRNVKAKIILQMNSPTERYLPSEELRELIHIAPVSDNQPLNNLVTKADVVTTLWQYIKFYKLQDNHDKLMILCDDRLKKLFSLDRMTFSQLPTLLEKHLLPPEPIAIEYLIRVDCTEHTSPVVFDIDVETDNEFKSKVTTVLGNNATNRAIYAMDEKIASLMTSINNAKIKRDFLTDFVANPVHFVNRWVASQAQDLEVLYSDTQVNLEESRKADFYTDTWTKEAVLHYLMAQTKEHMTNTLLKRPPN